MYINDKKIEIKYALKIPVINLKDWEYHGVILICTYKELKYYISGKELSQIHLHFLIV